MSQEAAAVWGWINSMKMRSGDFVDYRAFNTWCANEHLATAIDFIPVMDELVNLGNLLDKNVPGNERSWNYWVA
ncbi:hypothetical protein [Rahnella aceris]|uniref:Uncharacterized protein n=1 Tax=Rahnella sp. (strain Y9602) TaxID=2703885 RepID=A0ABW6CGG7_RAHSY